MTDRVCRPWRTGVMEGDEDRMGGASVWGRGGEGRRGQLGVCFPLLVLHDARLPSARRSTGQRCSTRNSTHHRHNPSSMSSCRCRGSPAAPHLVDTFTFIENVCHACYLLRESYGRDAGDTGRRHREGTRQGRPASCRLSSPLMQYALRRPRGQRQNGPDRRLTSTKMSSLTRPCSGRPD